MSKALPIEKHSEEIKSIIQNNNVSVIIGGTGSGKTTLLPSIIRQALPKDAKIAITQPRRIAAKSVAAFVARKEKTKIGDRVGYQIRFEDKTSEGTHTNFMTDGILLAKIQSDNLLSRYDAIVIDEAHERTLNIDFLLGLIKEIQQKRENSDLNPLKVIVTSATIEKDKFVNYFKGASFVEIPGRAYPVEIHYETEAPQSPEFAAAIRLKQIIKDNEDGDVLIFMPGQVEIDRTIKEINKLKLRGLDILPLHGTLSSQEQNAIFDVSKNRKVIVSTNIAETSITVPGINIVIDSGLIKEMENDEDTGIQHLKSNDHAKSGCIQRSGRAGRLSPGICYRLYTESNFHDRKEYQTPEIQRANISSAVLYMKKIGIKDIHKFDFIDAPDTEVLEKTIDRLKSLGAIDQETEEITSTGKIMATLPLEPNISRMLIEAREFGCVEEICTISAFLASRSPFARPKDKLDEYKEAHAQFKVEGSDFFTLLKVWKMYQKNRFSWSWASRNFLNAKALSEVKDIRHQLLHILKQHKIKYSTTNLKENISKALLSGFAENIIKNVEDGVYRRINSTLEERSVYPHPTSVIAKGESVPFFIASEIVNTERIFARICHAIKPEWIPLAVPHLVSTQKTTIRYDHSSDEVVKELEMSLKNDILTIATIKKPLNSQEQSQYFSEMISSGDVSIKESAQNNELVAKAEYLWIRSGGLEDVNPTKEKIASVYFKKLRGATSLRSISNSRKIDLLFRSSDLVPLHLIKSIREDNPECITVGSEEYIVEYIKEGDRFLASISVDELAILNMTEVPSLPSGRFVTIDPITSSGVTYKLSQTQDINLIKELVANSVIEKEWNLFTERSEKRISEKYEDLERVQYFTHPLTGEGLYAYPRMEESIVFSGEFDLRFSREHI